jgi:hypothetical protein
MPSASALPPSQTRPLGPNACTTAGTPLPRARSLARTRSSPAKGGSGTSPSQCTCPSADAGAATALTDALLSPDKLAVASACANRAPPTAPSTRRMRVKPRGSDMLPCTRPCAYNDPLTDDAKAPAGMSTAWKEASWLLPPTVPLSSSEASPLEAS